MDIGAVLFCNFLKDGSRLKTPFPTPSERIKCNGLTFEPVQANALKLESSEMAYVLNDVWRVYSYSPNRKSKIVIRKSSLISQNHKTSTAL